MNIAVISFCYVDDLVDGLIRLADSSVAEPVNLGNPNEMSISDFADVVANLVGDVGRVYKDLPVGDPVRRQPDISVARPPLDWEPVVPLVDGVATPAASSNGSSRKPGSMRWPWVSSTAWACSAGTSPS
ncbi:MAG: hypothetical protein IH850_12955 [Acidobacteria bacterium]|nr:hypothetical protein [Acidobacteriota bacterium]